MIRWALLLVANLTAMLWAVDAPQTARTAATAPAAGHAAVRIVRCSDGQEVLAINANQPLMMASVTKLFTAAAALYELGPDYEFATRVVAGAAPSGGAVPWLGVIASGTPALDEHHTERQPDRIFIEWANQLKAAGITRVSGDLIIDASLFSGPITPDSYPGGDRNVQAWYSAPASAFAWNDNCIEVRVVPTRPGETARVDVRPRSDLIQVTNRTSTVASGGKGLIVHRRPTANAVVVSGRYHEATSWYPMAIHEQPDLLAGHHMAAILRDEGITIAGDVVLGPLPNTSGPTVVTHRDPLMGSLTILNQRSQNFYGEQIFRLLGHRRHGTGSVAAGRLAAPSILTTSTGLPLTHTTILDGSGLSHGNRSSARDVTDLLVALHRDQTLGPLFASTLKDKWRRSIKGLVKTGTLRNARALAGYIDGADGHRYAFAILLERGETRDIGWAIQLRDHLFNAIADDLNPR